MNRTIYRKLLRMKYAAGIMLSAFCATVLAQGSPVTGMAEVNLGSTNSGEYGTIITVPVNVSLTGVTATDQFAATVNAALGNFRIAITYDNTLVKARVVNGAVAGGITLEYMQTNPAYIISNGASDTLVLTRSQTSESSPIDVINVAQIEFDVITPDPQNVPLNVSVFDLHTPIIFTGLSGNPVIGGENIPFQTTDGSINIIATIDTDGDTLPDAWELFYGLNPSDPADALLDYDGDGLDSLGEYQHSTNPFMEDTDADLVPDGAEVASGTDPNDVNDYPLWVVSTPIVDALELTPYDYLVLSNEAGTAFLLDVAPTGLSIDPVTGQINWTPGIGQTGDFDVTVRITNGIDNATQSYVITVDQKGDINADGQVNVVDMLLVQRHVLNLAILDAQQIERADLYPEGGDGVVNMSDLLLIMQKALGN